ncbi:uncharacterized protein LOC110713721 [Chenopodium quinoa]|uniref:uncharacterized protein LOC110713721 n=1 Tax=Chenopodium quinoa TaxID=63459 RepID=UPI000B775E5E|nr:uncharacterized protein LOC110713721 [Chenopodium quinoa]
MKFDIQYRLFSIFDDNDYLKETIDRLKHDNIMLNVELSLMKLCLDAPDSEVPPLAQYPNFEKLKSDLEDIKVDKARLEGELDKSRTGKQPVEYRVPDWITKAQTKRAEGLSFKKKFQKEKKYVNLPSSIVCYFCGNTRHKQIPVRGNNTWYLVSGCSKHMTGDKYRFLSLDAYYGGTVTFGDNMTGGIVAIGKVRRSSSHAIDNVFLVEGLKHNLLNISQFCDKEGTRKGNTYVVDLNEVPNRILTCLSVIENDPLLWHKRFRHASFTLLDKLRSKELVEGHPCIKFLYDKKEQRRTGNPLIQLRSDHGTEFENSKFDEFCTEHGMDHNFFAPRTPQQNGVVERKNRCLEDMARTMLISSGLPRNFWAEEVNTTCYILNRVSVRAITNKTPYELIKGRKPNISYFRSFGCKCFVHNNGKRNLGKFDERSDEAVFLGYASDSKAYKVYNIRTMCVEESVHIIFDEIEQLNDVQDCDDDFEIRLVRKTNPDEKSTSLQKRQVEIAKQMNPEANEELEMPNAPGTPPQEQNQDQNEENPVKVPNETQEKVPKEEPVNNDQERLNKARLVVQGFIQQEGIDYEETFSPIARLEVIRLLIAFAAYMGFTLFQMDVKCAFLNGFLNEEVYVEQPPGFESQEFLNHVIWLIEKALKVLWIKQQVRDFGLILECVPIYCDNTSVICISKDPVQHSKFQDMEKSKIMEIEQKEHLAQSWCAKHS